MFLTLIHNAFGSMVDATETAIPLGPSPTEAAAKMLGDRFLAKVHPHYAPDMWCSVVEIPTIPRTNVDEVVKQFNEELEE